MSTKNAVITKMKEEMSKSSKLKMLSFDKKLPFDKAMEMREKQEESYKKAQFLKQLNIAMKN